MKGKIFTALLTLFISASLITSAQSQVSFQYEKSLIFVNVKINGNRANFLFLINTTATNTAVDAKVADIIRLPIVRKNDTVVGTAGREIVDVRKVKNLGIGDAIVKDMEVNTRDLSKFVAFNGRKVDGILGMDFLKRYALNIDFKKNKITFLMKATPGKQKFIPFEMVDGVPRFEAYINDTLTTTLNYNSAISMESGRNIYINVPYRQWQEIIKTSPGLETVGYLHAMGIGGPLYLQVVKLKSMLLDTLDIRYPYVVIQPEEGYFKRKETVGFFGNNLLEKYSNITLDFHRNRMIFNDTRKQPPSKKNKGKVVNIFATKL